MLRFILAWLVLGTPPSLAETKTSVLSEALIAYDQGDYDTSTKLFSQLATQSPAHGSLYYNLGNSYYRRGEKGKAVAAYLAARSLTPRDPDIRANLKFVHAQGKDNLATSRSSFFRMMFFWLDWSTPKELLYFAAMGGSLGFVLLFLSLLLKRAALKVWGQGVLLGSILAFAAFTVSLTFEEQWGAVIQSTAPVFSGPGASNTVVFELHEGAPFVVDLEENDWVRIELADGKKGWLARANVAIFSHSPQGGGLEETAQLVPPRNQ
ncbi:MAG: tetratricopeptide repeat protein [Deltaproteobacteria bacterium]|nr:tetratricopeptide repeat protein [Deltaproteobacteria bacterium]